MRSKAGGSCMDLARGLDTLLLAAAVAALAPMLVALLPGPRIPQVVVLLAGGVLIGPEVLAWAERPEIDLLANVGLGFLFLLAGYELDLHLFQERPGRLAVAAWLVTAAVAAALVGALAAAGQVHAFIPVAHGLTTTTHGTQLPIRRDPDMLVGRFGRYLLAAGAVGELFPIFAIAVFLGASNKFVALGSLAAVGLLAVVLSQAPRLVRGNRLGRILREGEGTTAQTTLRWTVLLLLLLLVIAEDFGLDVVLGAFMAGIVLRRWAPGDVHALDGKLDAIGYGFFIPLFFVASGMGLDIRSIAEAPARLGAFFVLLLVVRGVPALVLYRRDLPAAQRAQMMLLTATALPLLVALAEIGLRNGTMLRENAAALVGAGALSVLVFPMAAVALERRRRAAGRPTVAPSADAPPAAE